MFARLKKLTTSLTGGPAVAAPEAPVIIVSGLPRSGTSMMMKMLEAGGVPVVVDHVRQADEDNPKGYYEFEQVKQIKQDASWLPEARGKVVKMVAMLLYDLPASEQYNIIFMRRTMAEILASQRKMLVRSGENPNDIDDAQMGAMFQKHLEQIDHWLARQPNVRLLDVQYDRVIQAPADTAAQVNQFMGGTLDALRMAAVVDPALYRNRA